MQAQVTFGSFRFEPATARLWDNGDEVKLTRKAALVLGALLERPGTPMSKQELFASVWRGTWSVTMRWSPASRNCARTG